MKFRQAHRKLDFLLRKVLVRTKKKIEKIESTEKHVGTNSQFNIRKE